jgi:hypothetical protein
MERQLKVGLRLVVPSPAVGPQRQRRAEVSELSVENGTGAAPASLLAAFPSLCCAHINCARFWHMPPPGPACISHLLMGICGRAFSAIRRFSCSSEGPVLGFYWQTPTCS